MVAGGFAAVALGAAAAYGVGRSRGPTTPPPASVGGLQVEVGENTRASLDPAKPLRCFVDGKFVGLETLTVCAGKNGVAAQALDVGLDATGELAAATDVPLDPLPAVDVAAETPSPVAAPALEPLPELGPVGGVQTTSSNGAASTASPCISHGPNGWTTVSEAAPLGQCVMLLFDGRCQTPGNALYGRWGDQTVRVVPGKVEISADGQTFTTLANQGQNCTIPPI